MYWAIWMILSLKIDRKAVLMQITRPTQQLEASESAANGASAAELQTVNVQTAMAHARTAALWISANRPDVAMGVEPELRLVAEDDQFTLPELEDYGRSGNAVKLCSGDFGALWWCDPEGRQTSRHECLLYAAKATVEALPRTILLRFYRPEAI